MDVSPFSAGPGSPGGSPGTGSRPVTITRVTESQWLALDDNEELGRGDVSHRPDGRMFVSVDSWQADVFDRLAAAMAAELPGPLHAVVHEDDLDTRAAWERAGFAVARREREYVVPTDPRITGLDAVPPPPDVTVVPLGRAQEGPLRALHRAVRAEVGATVGWETMPAEVLPRPDGVTVVDPSKYAVAEVSGHYVGLVRVVPRRHEARIGLVAVLAEQRRRGVARALLADVLGALHRAGVTAAWAEVDESNIGAARLIEGLGGQRRGGILELVRR
ncbi:GNAT family N-acetyltransferase [Streptacidiphilus neutrinimicus]|uniref:GNAT family N-acetyltransferase n=1 Tax=Streptacidiphilus neutrinimicus TaxID=105420 RepID=UPI0009FD0830|nr:GNAT family N-acetyltransferase [Streptacidiphilus neutrinimicus]